MEEKTQASISELIKEYRKEKNMTQEQLCEAAGISISTLKKYETGLRSPKAEQLKKIAEALGISEKEFTPIKVKDRSDFLVTLMQLDKEADLHWDFDRSENGMIIPESLTISFEDRKLNNLLALYLMAKDKAKTQKELESMIRMILYSAKVDEV